MSQSTCERSPKYKNAARPIPTTTTSELVIATPQFSVPIEAGDIQIREVGPDVHVDMSYTTTVVVIPGVFETDWTFTPSTSTRMLVGNRRRN